MTLVSVNTTCSKHNMNYIFVLDIFVETTGKTAHTCRFEHVEKGMA